MMQYEILNKKYTDTTTLYNKKYQQIVYLIFLIIGAIGFCLYQFFKNYNLLYILLGLILFIAYLFILKKQDYLKWKRNIAKQQNKVNTDEINFISYNIQPFKSGIEYATPNHPYTNDIDIFGKGSLYQYLNRTATFIGEKKLAESLSTLLPNETIIQKQNAIKELANKIEWRQKINAIGQLVNDDKDTYQNIKNWTTTIQPKLTLSIKLFSILLITAAWVCYFFLIYKGTGQWFNIATFAFLANNAFLGTQFKKIKKELIVADNIDSILKNYSQIIKEIEQEHFQSTYLIQLQNKLKFQNELASTKIKELSNIFGSLNSINNVFGALILNGLFLSHIFILNKLLNWKHQHAAILQTWLDTIGEIEALNSIANLSYNNPDYAFPNLNENYKIDFENLGHPLIENKNRVSNDVTFNNNQFMILSGSNMSGKSTFLRAIGINMVLAGIGSPVCATSASVHPLPVYASMRLADSLTENESYFFAEIKRLHFIKEALDQKICFVLLDEILRGTNSDDKQNGTIQFIKKIIEKKAVGIIATHDLEVCETTTDYPNQLFNKCFEVEIINNNLHFDFKLRDGICKNKSATFLMEKLGVI